MAKKLKVLYYHEVVEQGQGFSYQKIEIEKFEQQMAYLQAKGYKTLYFSDLDKPLPSKAVIVSFDDGFRSVYENAAPIMEKYGIRGNVYLPTRYIGNVPHFMDWDMVQELQKGSFEMQAHTHSHVDVRTLDEGALQEQIKASDDLFREKLGYLPRAFCLPFGTYDRESVKKIRQTGRYDYILGSYYGDLHIGKTDRVLPRIGISNDDTMEDFAAKLQGKRNWKGPLQRLRLCLKNLKKERITHYEY